MNIEKQFNAETYNDMHALLEWELKTFEANYNPPQFLQYIFPNQLYYAHLGYTIGSEQAHDRPVLVVDCYKTSPICIVIPITLERLNDSRPYHVDLSNGKGTALVEQIRAISKLRIFDYVYVNKEYAKINEDDRTKINEQLEHICRLKPLYKKED